MALLVPAPLCTISIVPSAIPLYQPHGTPPFPLPAPWDPLPSLSTSPMGPSPFPLDQPHGTLSLPSLPAPWDPLPSLSTNPMGRCPFPLYQLHGALSLSSLPAPWDLPSLSTSPMGVGHNGTGTQCDWTQWDWGIMGGDGPIHLICISHCQSPLLCHTSSPPLHLHQ